MLRRQLQRNGGGRGGGGGRLIMLNADMALVSDFAGNIDEGTGQVSCAIQDSPGNNLLLQAF